MLLLIFAGAGVQAPPPVVIKVIGRAGGATAARGGASIGATFARGGGESAPRGSVGGSAGAAGADGGDEARGSVMSGEEP